MPAVDEKKEAKLDGSDASVKLDRVAMWIEAANKVYMLLLMAVQSKSLSTKINNVPQGDAHGVWKLLVAKYERQSATSLMQVMEKLALRANEFRSGSTAG